MYIVCMCTHCLLLPLVIPAKLITLFTFPFIQRKNVRDTASETHQAKGWGHGTLSEGKSPKEQQIILFWFDTGWLKEENGRCSCHTTVHNVANSGRTLKLLHQCYRTRITFYKYFCKTKRPKPLMLPLLYQCLVILLLVEVKRLKKNIIK